MILNSEEREFMLQVEKGIDEERERLSDSGKEMILAMTMLNKATEILDEEDVIEVHDDLVRELEGIIEVIEAQF